MGDLVASDAKEVARRKANKMLGQSSQVGWIRRSEEVAIEEKHGEEVSSEQSTTRLVGRRIAEQQTGR